MGKKAKGLRHIEKMREKRKAKAMRAAAYEAMATKGDNTKRKQARYVKPLVRTRDPMCKNIGDIHSDPEFVIRSIQHFDRLDYSGKYKQELAVVRMINKFSNNPQKIVQWLDRPYRNHLNQTTTRRNETQWCPGIYAV